MLCRTGAAVERLFSRVHVCAWRDLLCAGGKFKAPAAGEKAAGTGHGSGLDHNAVGAGVRSAGEPKLSGVGLPEYAAECIRSDLSALYAAGDPGELCGHAAL